MLALGLIKLGIILKYFLNKILQINCSFIWLKEVT